MAFEGLGYVDHGTIRSAAILTTSYVVADIIGTSAVKKVRTDSQIDERNQLMLAIDFTIGSLTDLRIKIETSPDKVNWYQEVSNAISSGVVTVSLAERRYPASGAYRIAVPLKDKYVRVSAKGTGTVTSSSCTIKAVTGIA